MKSSFKILDRYIIRKFLGTFFYAIALIIAITIVFDISEKIEDFISKDAPLSAIVFGYYMNFIPYFVNLFSPLFTFIAVIFFTSRMASNTEIVAILSSGVSFNRLLRPYMVSATVLTVLSFMLNNFIIPPANAKRLDFENTYIRNAYYFSERNLHRQVSPGTFVFFESYNNQRNIGYKFTMEQFEENKLVYKLSADYIRWDTLAGNWEVENYFIRKIEDLNEVVESGLKKQIHFNLNPQEFNRRIDNVETMNMFELDKFIAEERYKGSENVVYYEIEKHKRIAMPFATFILTIIGVSIASRKVRGGIGLHIGIGLLIAFSYIMFQQIAITFATNAGLSAMIAMWIPNFLYLVLGLYLLRIAPK
jgi:lipopolysaccharide export system permease protein